MEKDKRWQVRLTQGDSRLTCWVDRPVRVGNQITIKGEDDVTGWWTVESVSEPKALSEIKRGWGQTDIPRGQTPRVV
jgi:hypothetical protein